MSGSKLGRWSNTERDGVPLACVHCHAEMRAFLRPAIMPRQRRTQLARRSQEHILTDQEASCGSLIRSEGSFKFLNPHADDDEYVPVVVDTALVHLCFKQGRLLTNDLGTLRGRDGRDIDHGVRVL
jgi:hypothetical protein